MRFCPKVQQRPFDEAERKKFAGLGFALGDAAAHAEGATVEATVRITTRDALLQRFAIGK